MKSYSLRLSFRFVAPARQTFVLAVNDDIDPDQLRTVLGEAFAEACPLSLKHAPLDHFDTEPLVLWPSPAPTSPEQRS